MGKGKKAHGAAIALHDAGSLNSLGECSLEIFLSFLVNKKKRSK